MMMMMMMMIIIIIIIIIKVKTFNMVLVNSEYCAGDEQN